jgi:hypothetical protein
MTSPRLEIHYADDWAALYVDGRLDRVGDAYLAEERAFEIAGVTIVRDDAFMCGQTQADGVAKALEDVAAFRARRIADLTEATRLREEAARLAERAGQLDGNAWKV